MHFVGSNHCPIGDAALSSRSPETAFRAHADIRHKKFFEPPRNFTEK
ncbi:MAG: hypothetical protein RL352_1244, partial [Actinomycetota bacterium]